jgi:signal transduction histidine kinase/integral membrane sensor domain MASE1
MIRNAPILSRYPMSVEHPHGLGSTHRISLPAIAFGACAGYYLASIVGLQLRLPPATTSVLWPPNAILTSALLLAPPRRWPAILLAVLPVHLFIQLQTEFPLRLILALFVTNCCEALLAAGGLYWLSDAPSRFDTLRRLTVFFLVAVLAAPLLSSFADATAVAWFRGESYWHVWRVRSLSNVLAELTVVPAVVGGVLGVLRWRHGAARGRRYLEGLILALGLCSIGLLDFGRLLWTIPAIGAVSRQTPLAVQLPFLLWAAVRFGPTGAGLMLLTTSVLSAWSVVHGVGPFASIAPATTVTALTISLIVVATTLLSLATLLEERRQAQHALRIRLRFEELLSRLSAALVQLPSDQMTRAFEAWLGRIGGVLGIDSLTVFAASTGAPTPQAVYSWTDVDAGGPLAASPIDHLEWARRCLMSAQPVIFSETDDAASEPERTPTPQSILFKAGGAIPLVGEDELIGALAFGAIREPQWSDDLVANTQLVGEVLASALKRKHSEDALRKSEVMKSAILQSLASGVAVIDRSGTLLQVNDNWTHVAKGSEWMNAQIGSNLLARYWAAFEHGDRLAGDVVAGVASVLEGSRARFIVEHRTDTEAVTEWWSLTAVPLNRPEGGAVLTRANITDLRRAEMEAQRSREELAHVSRVSTVGEMTASLAHQLNQPLAAIMTNAQAGRRILDSAQPDVNEIRAILLDIVKDDRRASDVIQRLRELLRKGQLEMTKVNLASAIRDVVDLINSEAIIRNVAVSLSFDHEPVFVRGDRVQLQQVMLNLLHNAMEAMSDVVDRPRRIVIGCEQTAEQQVIVSVHDSGPGLRPGTEDSIFEPFYTTKATGMGMGLSIARSILEAHNGAIRAANDPVQGARFEFFLPASSGRDK